MKSRALPEEQQSKEEAKDVTVKLLLKPKVMPQCSSIQSHKGPFKRD